MTALYKTIACPRCGEDDLFVTMNKKTNKLYLCCDECMASWNDIDDAKRNINMFIDVDADAADPTADEIIKYGWAGIISGKIDV